MVTYTKGEDKSFLFYSCPRYEGPYDKGCGYFEWLDGLYYEVIKIKREIKSLDRKYTLVMNLGLVLFVLTIVVAMRVVM